MLDPNHLVVFYNIVKTGSFSNAASILGVSSAHVNRSVKKLVLLNKGIGMLPYNLAKPFLDDGSLQDVPFLNKYYQSSDLYVLYPSRDFIPERVRVFVDFMKKNIKFMKFL